MNPRDPYQKKFLGQKKEEVAVNFGAFDEDNPRALINLVPKKVKEAIINAISPEMGGDIRFISWSEARLERELNKELARLADDPSRKIDAKDHMLRLNFWAEYYRVQDTKSKSLDVKNVYRNVTYSDDFYRRIQIPLYMAWLISAPTNLALAQEETLMLAMRTLRHVVSNKDAIWEIKETHETDPDTGENKRTRHKKLNTRAVAEIRKIAEDLANRRQGAVVQRHQIATAQLPVEPLPQKAIPQAESREELEAEIKELEAKANPGPTDVVDAEVDEENT